MLFLPLNCIVIFCVQVFSNMTSNIRKALFKALMAQSIENENTVILDNGEEVHVVYRLG